MKKHGTYILIFLLAVIFFTSAGAVIKRTLWKNDGIADGVRITVEGEIAYEIDFHTDPLPQTIELEGKDGGHNTILVEDGRVCIQHADCPDQICVHQGWITDNTLPIVCLPHQVIVEMIGGESSGLDTATG